MWYIWFCRFFLMMLLVTHHQASLGSKASMKESTDAFFPLYFCLGQFIVWMKTLACLNGGDISVKSGCGSTYHCPTSHSNLPWCCWLCCESGRCLHAGKQQIFIHLTCRYKDNEKQHLNDYIPFHFLYFFAQGIGKSICKRRLSTQFVHSLAFVEDYFFFHQKLSLPPDKGKME